MNRLVWLDLETTGLNPDNCLILEVGIIITDEKLNELGRFEEKVRVSEATYAEWEPEARGIHDRSGLLREALKSDWVWGEVRILARSFLKKHLVGAKATLAGSSVHFDRAFLQKHAPEILRFVGHRHLDTSVFKVLGEVYGWKLPEAISSHTALADLERSIALLKWAEEKFGFRGAR